MATVLNITDEGVLSANTELAIGMTFLRRSEYSPDVPGAEELPAHFAGTNPAHAWLSSLYNPGAPGLSLIRGGIVAVKQAATGFEIVMIGDSKLEGFNTGADRWRYSWPGMLRDMLTAVEGTIMAFPRSVDTRWATNMVQGNSLVPGLIKDTADPQATLTYATPHVGGSFWVHILAGGTVTVAVDGGSAQSFTVPAGNGFHEITPVVAGAGSHTYAVASTGALHLYGFRPEYAAPVLKITNLGRSGSRAEGWLAGYSATQTGLWDGMVAATTPDAIVSALGTNQAGNPALNATSLTALFGQIAALSKPAVIVTPGGLDLSASPSWFEQYRAQLEAADTHNMALIDFASVIGTGPDAQARGLMADANHENRKGFAYEAAAFLRIIR